jgi:hypothetical protein
MPRVKGIQTLQDKCIEFVVKNIDYWCKQSTNDLFSIGANVGNNPFDQLRKFNC